jgi:hypothetical protein
MHKGLQLFCLFLWWYWGLNSLAKPALYHLSHTPVHFVLVILEMVSCELICLDRLQTEILLILASQVARITAMSYWQVCSFKRGPWAD